MSMSDDEPSEMTKDEKLTGGAGGVWDGSVGAAAEGFASVEGEDTVGAASAPPLARRSRMTNPCSSSAMFFSPAFRRVFCVPYHRVYSVASRGRADLLLQFRIV